MNQESLEASIADANNLLTLSKTQRVKEVLEKFKEECEKKIQVRKQEEGKREAKEKVKEPEQLESSLKPRTDLKTTDKFEPIQKFSWDQDGYSGENVFVYITLAGVGSLKPSQISCVFSTDSFDVKVFELNGSNYRLLKKPLNKLIDPAKSKFKVKSDRIVLTLKKAADPDSKYGGSQHWSDLLNKNPEEKLSKADGEENASKSLMNMMKKMYDEGDDNMKKTIGEAMLKSRENRGEPFK